MKRQKGLIKVNPSKKNKSWKLNLCKKKNTQIKNLIKKNQMKKNHDQNKITYWSQSKAQKDKLKQAKMEFNSWAKFINPQKTLNLYKKSRTTHKIMDKSNRRNKFSKVAKYQVNQLIPK